MLCYIFGILPQKIVQQPPPLRSASDLAIVLSYFTIKAVLNPLFYSFEVVPVATKYPSTS